MRYDVEVSGFPSSHAGHLCLLRLIEDDYPGTKLIEEWPSWTMPVLQWGQRQGAVVGYSHSGWGLALPDYGPDGSRIELIRRSQSPAAGRPRGRQAAGLRDAAVRRHRRQRVHRRRRPRRVRLHLGRRYAGRLGAEHLVSHAKLRLPRQISGETDFPCIYGERVGLGRIYVKLDDDQPLDYDRWVQGVKLGRSYCCDGLSHVMDFRVSDESGRRQSAESVHVGEPGPTGETSQLNLDAPGKVRVEFDVAALLAEQSNDQTESIRTRRLDAQPYWHIERPRIGDTRAVPLS